MHRTSLHVAQRAARSVRLRYLAENQLTIRREGSPGRFRYRDRAGRIVRDAKTRARIDALVLPPAWKDVRIAAHANGHLQAIGRDARGRKQYRYHERWRETRDEAKFERLLKFAECLPQIRRRIASDLKRRQFDRRRVLACVLRLLDSTGLRIGNEEYARTNHSFGLTTLKDRHVQVRAGKATFQFVGKSGIEFDVEVDDPRVAKLIKKCQDLPGQHLFQYRDEHGRRRKLGSTDVNRYLQELTGETFTAKDFRTWRGSVLAAALVAEAEPAQSATQAKRTLVAVVKEVAGELGNTAAVCRASYIHPAILASYADAIGGSTTTKVRVAKRVRGLHAAELALLRVLRTAKSDRRRAG